MALPKNICQIEYDDLRRMHEENQQDAAECEQVTQSTNRGESYYADDGRSGLGKISHPHLAFYMETLYRDPKTDGFIIGCPHGSVIKQGERNHYYRGETQIYDKSGTTLSRGAEKYSDEDKLLYRLVADMRIVEFEHFIRMFDRVNCWDEKGLTVLTEPIAQHYGLQTDWLDITNDFDTALFFATCYWERKEKKWYPLTREQTEHGEEKRKYGVLFHAPAWRVMSDSMRQLYASNYADDEGLILPIGYQPFMRCHSQYGYGLHMRNSIPLQENPTQEAPTFERLFFRHSEKLSKAVYDLMDGGRKIYPEEGLDEFQDVLDSIATATVFSESAFVAALEKNQLSGRANEYRSKLERFEVTLQRETEHGSERYKKRVLFCGEQHPFSVSRQRIRRANRQDKCFSIEEYYHIQLTARYIYSDEQE